jgi:FkbM family methyltransferase
MASTGFKKFFRLTGKSRVTSGSPTGTRFSILRSAAQKKSAVPAGCWWLPGDENVVVLIVDALAGEKDWSMTIDPPPSSQQRVTAYLQIADALGKRRIKQALVFAKNAGGLFAATAVKDITAVPMALILPDDRELLNDRSTDPFLAEAIDKATVTFSPSAPLISSVQTNLGKKIWFLPVWLQPSEAPTHTAALRNRQVLNWIFDAMEDGFPSAAYFQAIEGVPGQGSTGFYADPPAPRSIHFSIHDYFQALHRLAQTGYQPEFIVDVGASTGYWSHIASRIFPKSRFYLIEPLLKRYQQMDKTIYSLHPEFITIASAAGDKADEVELNVSPDLYSSSFLDGSEVSPNRQWDKVRVPVKTLDEISTTFSIAGRGLLKIDVQLAEHLVLDGATRFLDQVDVVCAELSLGRFVQSSKTIFEMITKLHHLGFEYFDFAGSWRDPRSGCMIQQDTVFVRAQLADNLH